MGVFSAIAGGRKGKVHLSGRGQSSFCFLQCRPVQACQIHRMMSLARSTYTVGVFL